MKSARKRIPTISQATVEQAAQYAAQADLDRLVELLCSEECRAYLEYLIKEEFRRFPDEKTVSESDFYKSLRDDYGANPGVDAWIRKLESTHLDLIINFALERARSERFLSVVPALGERFNIILWLRSHAKFAPLLYSVYLVQSANEPTPHATDDNRQQFQDSTALQACDILACTPIVRLAFYSCHRELRRRLPDWQDRWTQYKKAMRNIANARRLPQSETQSLRASSAALADTSENQSSTISGSFRIEAQLIQDQYQVHNVSRLPQALIEEDPNELLKLCIHETLILAYEIFTQDFRKYEERRGFRFDKWFYNSLAQRGVQRAMNSLHPRPTEEANIELRPLIIDTNSRDSNIVENFKRLVPLESFVKYLVQTPLLSDEEKTILKLHFVDKADDLLVAKLLGIGGRNPSDAVRQRRSVIYKKLATGLLVEFALQDDFTRSVVKLAVVLYRDYSLSNVDEETAYREGTSLLEAVANQLGTNLDKVVNAFDGFIDRLEHYFGLDISQTREQALPQGETLLKRVLDFISSKVFACFSLEAPVAEAANEISEANPEVDEDDR